MQSTLFIEDRSTIVLFRNNSCLIVFSLLLHSHYHLYLFVLFSSSHTQNYSSIDDQFNQRKVIEHEERTVSIIQGGKVIHLLLSLVPYSTRKSITIKKIAITFWNILYKVMMNSNRFTLLSLLITLYTNITLAKVGTYYMYAI